MTDQPAEQNSPIHNLIKDTQASTPNINRRRFLQSTSLATVAGASMMLAGCDNDNDDNDNTAQVSFLHGVASGDGRVSEDGDGADAGETVGGAGAQAGPRLNADEIVRRKGGEEFAEAFDDALEALGVYG